MAFQLDTSGAVTATDAIKVVTIIWSDLDPFTQGYIEALLADFRFFHLECPSCEWDCVVGPPGIRDMGLMCPLCAGDSGRSVTLRTVGGDLPATVEGVDARRHPSFANLAPKTLARIMEDCAAAPKHVYAGWTPQGAGRQLWRDRQDDMLVNFPPLTPALSDDGKVVFK